MKRPKRAKVGHQTYEIRWLTLAEWEANGGEENCSGRCNDVLGRIEIVLGARPEDYLRETLLHELIHATFASSRARMYIGKADDPEEFVCDTQAPMFAALFRDNPKIRKYLFEE